MDALKSESEARVSMTIPEEDQPRCRKCGYLLLGLDNGRCPECGRDFDLRDPTTFTCISRSRRAVSRLVAPPGRATYSIAFVCLALLLFYQSLPGGRSTFLMLLFPFLLLGIAIGLAWFIKLLIAVLLTLIRPTELIRRRDTVRWLGVPAIVAVAILCTYLKLPLYATFFLSLSDMNRVAQQTAGRATAPTVSRVGLYGVKKIEGFPGGMRFVVAGAGYINREGFAFSPNGVPPRIGDDYYVHFYGPWYLWTERF